MKRIQINESGLEPLLIEVDLPQPSPREGEVLVRVQAAGVTPTELEWYPTSHTKDGGKRAGAVPSHEFSGEVAEIGAGVVGLSIGDQVYGMNDWFADGALAEYCLTQPGWIAPKPQSLTHVEAASAPIGALTAWQGLFERANVRSGERVLIHGGAGGVGIFAIQLAHSRCAHVIATASARNIEFVKDLGADEAIDYKAERFEDRAPDIDVVFDGVGGDTLRRSWGVLRHGGRLITIAADAGAATDERTKQAFFIVEPRREQLIDVGKMFDARKLRTIVDTVLPLARASDAYTGKVEKKGRGKLVVTIPR